MGDAPERIWLLPFDGEQRAWCNEPDPAGAGHEEEADEYLRADIAAAREANLRAEVERVRANRRETFEAMVAMRDTINEAVPIPSLESDLSRGPDDAIFCEVVATAVVTEAARLRAEVERLTEERDRLKHDNDLSLHVVDYQEADIKRLRALLDKVRKSRRTMHRRAQKAEGAVYSALLWLNFITDKNGGLAVNHAWALKHARATLAKIGGQ